MAFPTRLPEAMKRALPKGVSLFPRAKHKRWILQCAPDWHRQVTAPPEVVTCDEALAWMLRHLADKGIDPGAAAERLKRSGRTIAECSKKWLVLLEADERVAPASYQSAKGHMANWILPRWGQTPIGKLDIDAVPELRAWLRSLRAKHPTGGRTIEHVISTFTSFVDAAMAEGWVRVPTRAGAGVAGDTWALQAANILRHPGVRDEMPKVKTKDPVRLPIPTIQQLLDAYAVDLESRARYAVAACTGMRDGEIAGIQISRLDRRAETPTVRIEQAVALIGKKGRKAFAQPKDPKTESSIRTLPLHACALEAIDEWLAVGWPRLVGRRPRPDDYLFPRPDGKPSRPRSAEQLRDDLAAAKLPNELLGRPVAFKDFRSSFLTWLDEYGVPPMVRKRLAGHRVTDVTEASYTVRELARLAEAVALLPLRWTPSRMEPVLEGSRETANCLMISAPPARVERTTFGLGNRCSIH